MVKQSSTRKVKLSWCCAWPSGRDLSCVLWLRASNCWCWWIRSAGLTAYPRVNLSWLHEEILPILFEKNKVFFPVQWRKIVHTLLKVFLEVNPVFVCGFMLELLIDRGYFSDDYDQLLGDQHAPLPGMSRVEVSYKAGGSQQELQWGFDRGQHIFLQLSLYHPWLWQSLYFFTISQTS